MNSAQKEVNCEFALEILRVPLLELVDEFTLYRSVNLVRASLFTLLLRVLDHGFETEDSSSSAR